MAVLIFGFLPQFSTAAWAVVAALLMITMFGPIVEAPQLVLDISPFQHVPKLPGAELTAAPLLWLGGVAVVAIAAGLAGFRQRGHRIAVSFTAAGGGWPWSPW